MTAAERFGVPYALRSLRWFKAGKLPSYEGMQAVEQALMDWFWSRHVSEYLAAAYNVRVGRGRPAPEWADEALQRDWQMSTQLRIDALLWDGNTLTVAEVKPVAGMEALGQAYFYPALLSRTYYIATPVRSIVICDDVHPDLVRLFVDAGIGIFVRQPLTAAALYAAS